MHSTSKNSIDQSIQQSPIVDQLMPESYDDKDQHLSSVNLDKSSNISVKYTDLMLNSETVTEIKELTTDLETQKATNLPCKPVEPFCQQSSQFAEFVASSV